MTPTHPNNTKTARSRFTLQDAATLLVTGVAAALGLVASALSYGPLVSWRVQRGTSDGLEWFFEIMFMYAVAVVAALGSLVIAIFRRGWVLLGLQLIVIVASLFVMRMWLETR